MLKKFGSRSDEYILASNRKTCCLKFSHRHQARAHLHGIAQALRHGVRARDRFFELIQALTLERDADGLKVLPVAQAAFKHSLDDVHQLGIDPISSTHHRASHPYLSSVSSPRIHRSPSRSAFARSRSLRSRRSDPQREARSATRRSAHPNDKTPARTCARASVSLSPSPSSSRSRRRRPSSSVARGLRSRATRSASRSHPRRRFALLFAPRAHLARQQRRVFARLERLVLVQRLDRGDARRHRAPLAVHDVVERAQGVRAERRARLFEQRQQRGRRGRRGGAARSPSSSPRPSRAGARSAARDRSIERERTTARRRDAGEQNSQKGRNFAHCLRIRIFAREQNSAEIAQGKNVCRT